MNWKETLEEKHRLEDLLKARCEIFQVEAKEDAAELFNQPLDTYYHMPFVLWRQVNPRVEEFWDCMHRDFAAVQEWSGQDLSKVPYGQWVRLYREWLRTQ